MNDLVAFFIGMAMGTALGGLIMLSWMWENKLIGVLKKSK